jgi:hypothetical protein
LRQSPGWFALCLGCALLGASAANADALVLTPVGSPSFQLTDFHQFTAPIGTAADSYAEFTQTLQAILPPPNYQFLPGAGLIGPGTPTPGPYTQDIAKGLANLGVTDQSSFQASDFSNGNGAYLAFMIVPSTNPVLGSSSDSANGPIIPNSAFPLSLSGVMFRNGILYDQNYAPAVSIPGAGGFDGWSHLPMVLAENSDFGPAGIPPTGNFTFDVTLLDGSGNGYDIKGGFSVTPEPGSLTLAAVAALSALGYCGRRRAVV